MKILIATIEHVEEGERYADDKGWSFGRAFGRLNVDVEKFFYRKKGRLSFLEKDKHLKRCWRSIMNKRLLARVRETHPDLLLVLKGETIQAETLWEIRKKTSTIIVNVFPDNPILMGNFEAIAPCHYYFVKDSYVVDTLRKVGLRNVHYLPQCTDPEVHRPVQLTDEDRAEFGANVSLMGTMYPYRLKFMESLVEFKPVIWGKGWGKCSNKEIRGLSRDRDVRGLSKAKVLSATVISLNPHHPLNDIKGVNRRTYDIAACRSFQLVDRKEDMDDIFTIGKEIICFDTIQEVKKHLEYYLSHPDERVEIAHAAYQRVVRRHTYDHRAREILDMVMTVY